MEKVNDSKILYVKRQLNKRMWSVLLLNRIDIKYQNSWQQVDKQTKQCKMDDDTIDATFFNAVTVVMLCEPCNTDNQTNKDTTHDAIPLKSRMI